jgi:DNA-binding CsgD family transcriptional regulator
MRICNSRVKLESASSPRSRPPLGDRPAAMACNSQSRKAPLTYTSTTSSPLRGRRAEMAALMAVLDTLSEGRGGSALLLGEAGGGKSRLLDEAGDRAQDLGYVVARIYADQTDSLAPMGTLLHGLIGIGSSLDGSELLAGAAERISTGVSVVQEVQSVLERTSAAVPVVVVIDDVDRADELTVHAVRLLIRSLQSSPVGWLIAARSGPAPRLARLRTAIANSDGAILSLVPLSDEDSRQVTDDLYGRPAPETLHRRVSAAGGNPFLITELVRAGTGGGGATAAADRLEPGVPRRAIEAVEERLAELSVDARHLLEVASVLGRSFQIADVLGIMDSSVARQFPAIRQLVDSGVVTERDGRMMFTHDLLRETLISGLPAEVIRLLHRDAARYYMARGDHAMDIAGHLLAGTEPQDDATAEAMLDAAMQLVSSAPAQAVDLARKSLAMRAGRRGPWLARLPTAIEVLIRGGALGEASALLAAGVGHGLDGGTQADLRVHLCEGLWQRGRTVEAMTMLEAVDRSTVTPASAARLDVAAARIKLLGGRPQEALDELMTSLHVAQEAGDLRTITQALMSQSMALRFTGRLGESIEVGRRAVASLQGQSEWSGVDPRVWLTRSLVATDEFEEAAVLLRDLTRNALASEGLRDLPPLSASSARLHLARGELHDAVAEAEAGVAAMDATGRRELAADLFACAATVQWLIRGAEAANEAIARAEPYIANNSFRMNHITFARLIMHTDDPSAVAHLAEQVLGDLGQSYGQLIFDPMNGPVLARAFSRLGMFPEVDSILSASRQLAEQNPATQCWEASSRHVEGLRAGDVETLVSAARQFDHVRRPLAAGFALADAAREAHLRSDARSAELLTRAVGRFRELGAVAAADQLNTTLTGSSATQRRGAVGRPATGWASLTPAELRVVNLAATGATNKEIAEQLWISPYTVDTHMRHSLAKLGLRSRVALARLAVLHETSPEADAAAGA